MINYNTKSICDIVYSSKEIGFIKELSKEYKIDFNYLINFSLDLYNYELRIGVDPTGAKFLTLANTYELAKSNIKELE